MTYTTFLFCHSRENGNPDPTGSPIRSASLSVEDDGRGWIPRLLSCHSRASGNPIVLSGSRIKRGMTGGDGSRVSSLVIPAKAGIQSEWIPHQVRDDGGRGIPAKAGIQAGLDPQSEALCFRLRMTKGLSVEDDKGCVIPAFFLSFP